MTDNENRITANMTDELIRLFFVHTPSELILNGTVTCRRFPRQQFEELMRCYERQYTDTEARLIYESQEIEEKSVFHLLLQVAGDLLIIKNNRICCRYQSLLRWREISRAVGEDLLVCAFLAAQRLDRGKRWLDFQWPQVLGHENKQLNAILREGISDNHFHLFGSAPIFPITWLRLMNDVRHGKYMAGMMGIQTRRRRFDYHLGEDYDEYSPTVLAMQAALMRAVMFTWLKDERETVTSDQAGHSNCGEENWALDHLPECLSVLHSGEGITQEEYRISELIRKLRTDNILASTVENPLPDYLLEVGKDAVEKSSAWLFGGERKLVYDMLCDILIYHRLPEQVQNLLYPYLVIRTWFRGEMVQSNDNIGFDNFKIYSGRKGAFLPTGASAKEKQRYWEAREMKQNLKWMVEQAVSESLQPGNLQSLEIRITPGDSCKENAGQIRYYDRLLEKITEGTSLKDYFYVYHFTKKQDAFVNRARKYDMEMLPRRRHDELRRELDRKAGAIRKMRRLHPEQAVRVRGIDACSMEIGCRPEVFACVFRNLKADVEKEADGDGRGYAFGPDGDQKQTLPQLSVTYHAGEDFLDVVDGLRALDEAINFLEMGYGDRFGHATVLGLALDKWYDKKSYRIYLPIQDYLDNVVWLYHKLIEFQLEGFETLKDYLLKEYLHYFYEIYGEVGENGRSDIFVYYDAWKLRGDLPEYYETGEFVLPDPALIVEGTVNSRFPINADIRQNSAVSRLYYRYHYDEKAKEKGAKPKEISIPQMYVQGVIMLQKRMQRQIARRGIGIEANPSSNLMISTMENYAEHPVLNLYTLGLNDQRECAQMFVSINTDDRGVFHTSLENEYSFLASSVENIRDENGKLVYNPQNVYDWVNRIRIMGNEQVF